MKYSILKYSDTSYNGYNSTTKEGTTTSTFYPAVFSIKDGYVDIIPVQEVLEKEKALGTFLRYGDTQQDGILEIKNETTGEILSNNITKVEELSTYSPFHFLKTLTDFHNILV